MASPDEWRRVDCDGLDFVCEIWRQVDGGDRLLVKGPSPAAVLFYSTEAPTKGDGSISWEMVQTIIARRVNWYIEKKPNQWKRYWGEDGVFAKMGDNF